MRRAAIILTVTLCALSVSAMSLFEQSIARQIDTRFKSPDVSYLLFDARSMTPIAARWPDAGQAIPPGSLLKPLIAIAYAEGHGYKYPEFVCRGAADRCWYPPGHGRIGITQAVEFSCNAYFLRLARKVSPQDLRVALARLGIENAPDSVSPGSLIGLGGNWRIPPERLARAYLTLISQSYEPSVAPLIEGMALSAQSGTANAIGKAVGGAAVLAKTGTAPCVHRDRAPGDGYVLAVYPAESPRLLLLVRVHGVPGAEAAVTAGKILRIAVKGPNP
jgi:cell division protein FtsI/penicillin-binding protein 2